MHYRDGTLNPLPGVRRPRQGVSIEDTCQEHVLNFLSRSSHDSETKVKHKSQKTAMSGGESCASRQHTCSVRVGVCKSEHQSGSVEGSAEQSRAGEAEESWETSQCFNEAK